MKTYLFSGILILLSLSSCLTIVQSLVTADNIITDNRIAGQWIDSDSKNIFVQKFMESKFMESKRKGELTGKHEQSRKDSLQSREDSLLSMKYYAITFREKDIDYTWIAGIVKIKDQYYADFEPLACSGHDGEEAYQLDGQRFLSTSSIAKLVWKDNNSVVLNFLNGDNIKEIVLNGKARIRHEYDPLFNNFVITASSHELEQFLEKYGNNESLFKGGNIITLKRKI